MKKILFIFLSLALLTSVLGCTRQADPSAGIETFAENNQMFTDEFFADVIEICDTRAGVVNGDQMKPVIQYLKGLTLTERKEHLRTTNENGDPLTGLDAIVFKKGNGEEIVFLRNHVTMSCIRGLDACSYVAEGENLNIGLKAAFSE